VNIPNSSFVSKIYSELLQLFGHINASCSTKNRIKPELYTGLSATLAKQLADGYDRYLCVDNIVMDYPFISSNVMEQICNIISCTIAKVD
jgi:hypothetical protein